MRLCDLLRDEMDQRCGNEGVHGVYILHPPKTLCIPSYLSTSKSKQLAHLPAVPRVLCLVIIKNYLMSYLLAHLRSGWAVDQAILSEEQRVVILRFGHDWDPVCKSILLIWPL